MPQTKAGEADGADEADEAAEAHTTHFWVGASSAQVHFQLGRGKYLAALCQRSQ